MVCGTCDVATINSKVDVIDIALEECCFTVNSKLDILLDPGCTPTVLTTDDIDGNGLITLDQPGNYCLAEDMTATVMITAHNVCLDLNWRELTGRVVIHIYSSRAPRPKNKIIFVIDGCYIAGATNYASHIN